MGGKGTDTVIFSQLGGSHGPGVLEGWEKTRVQARPRTVDGFLTPQLSEEALGEAQLCARGLGILTHLPDSKAI